MRKAIKYYEKAIEVNPKNHYAWANLGHNLWNIGKNDDAKFALEKAIEIKPDHSLALIVLGRVYKEKGEGDKAKEVWEQAYVLLNRKWENESLDEVDYGWFISVAKALGYNDVAQAAEKERPKKSKSKSYNADNLITTTKKTQQ